VSRALVIGAQTSGLAGVENDACDVAAWLAKHGLEVDLRIGRAATRDSMLDGLRALAAQIHDDEAAVVYYAGHGGLLEVPGEPLGRLGFLVPTDYEPRAPFRGITETTWSALIAALTTRTRNVAVIHDCCHAARTVRSGDPQTRIRALGVARVGSIEIGNVGGVVRDVAAYSLGNPDAVRWSAASGDGPAWERADPSGRVRGVFTSILLSEADSIREQVLSWAEWGRRVRARVLQATGQRPEIEGATNRRVFGVDTVERPIRISVRPEGLRFVLAAGSVHGIERDDMLRSATAPLPTAVVTRTGLFESELRIEHDSERVRAFDAIVARRATRYSIGVHIDDLRVRAETAAAIDAAPRLCVGPPASATARVHLERERLWLFAGDEPLCLPLPADRDGIAGAVVQLSRLAAVWALQRTAAQLAGTGRLAMTVERVGGAPGELADGATISLGDRLCICLTNHTQRTLWLHVFAVGPGHALRVLGPISSGIYSRPRATEVLGGVPGLGRIGFALPWPAAVPMDRARPMELMALATTAAADLSCVVVPDLADTGNAHQTRVTMAPSATRSSEPSRHVYAAPQTQQVVVSRRHFLLSP